ncbi:hypothetical protein Phum_PHUM397870 [Pediculus humanus corporis]|uniref:C2H2-type domain-containing protein n=1 Tax=Pediculus humanus subsp. corporis TaxID=121224 RepID=E0VRH6_PEDHC|nr:uncharacterized protein Phum_PHUM397870 [Pediculus humanus corporis]EEB15982.1 hypothetical protein Phum_PHUM397870 [Pediculus humanus corporis]
MAIKLLIYYRDNIYIIDKSWNIILQRKLPLRAFPCTDCTSSFKHKRHLTYHRKWECNKPAIFPCEMCNKKFKTKNRRNEHVRRLKHFTMC